jgi:hypothetical protein
LCHRERKDQKKENSAFSILVCKHYFSLRLITLIIIGFYEIKKGYDTVPLFTFLKKETGYLEPKTFEKKPFFFFLPFSDNFLPFFFFFFTSALAKTLSLSSSTANSTWSALTVDSAGRTATRENITNVEIKDLNKRVIQLSFVISFWLTVTIKIN